MTTKTQPEINPHLERMENAAKYIKEELDGLEGAVFRVKAYFHVLYTKIGDLETETYHKTIKAAEDIAGSLGVETVLSQDYQLEILDALATITDAIEDIKKEASNENEN